MPKKKIIIKFGQDLARQSPCYALQNLNWVQFIVACLLCLLYDIRLRP